MRTLEPFWQWSPSPAAKANQAPAPTRLGSSPPSTPPAAASLPEWSERCRLPRSGNSPRSSGSRRAWTRVPATSERIPDAEMTKPRDPKAPLYHFRTLTVYEVFSPDGRFLGRVEFPRRTKFIEADGDVVWAIVREENDLPAVVRFRITPGLH